MGAINHILLSLCCQRLRSSVTSKTVVDNCASQASGTDDVWHPNAGRGANSLTGRPRRTFTGQMNAGIRVRTASTCPVLRFKAREVIIGDRPTSKSQSVQIEFVPGSGLCRGFIWRDVVQIRQSRLDRRPIPVPNGRVTTRVPRNERVGERQAKRPTLESIGGLRSMRESKVMGPQNGRRHLTSGLFQILIEVCRPNFGPVYWQAELGSRTLADFHDVNVLWFTFSDPP